MIGKCKDQCMLCIIMGIECKHSLFYCKNIGEGKIKYKYGLGRSLDRDMGITSHRHSFDHKHTYQALNYIFVHIQRYFDLHSNQAGMKLNMSNW